MLIQVLSVRMPQSCFYHNICKPQPHPHGNPQRNYAAQQYYRRCKMTRYKSPAALNPFPNVTRSSNCLVQKPSPGASQTESDTLHSHPRQGSGATRQWAIRLCMVPVHPFIRVTILKNTKADQRCAPVLQYHSYNSFTPAASDT